MQKCDLTAIALKIRKARARSVAPIMRPLHRHLLVLAADSARHGYCQRAGQEVRAANKIADETPTAAAYDEAVRRAHEPRARRRR